MSGDVVIRAEGVKNKLVMRDNARVIFINRKLYSQIVNLVLFCVYPKKSPGFGRKINIVIRAHYIVEGCNFSRLAVILHMPVG